MHDLDRKDLVFESEGYDNGFGEFDGDEYEVDTAEEGVFDEVEQSELASELLGVADDHELDNFLGSMLKKATQKLGIPSSITRHVGGLLKGAAKNVLPSLTQLAGGALGGPMGAALAGKAGPMLGSLLGMELEGLSPEDQEYEAAKQFVKLAGSSMQNAANAAGTGSPVEVAKRAVIDAARQHAPGLVRRAGRSGRQQQGTWYRRGNRIVIVGV